MKKGKKILITTFSIVGTLLISLGVVGVVAHGYGKKDFNNLPRHQEVTHKKIETYKAIGKGRYDLEGNYFQIKGVNFGNFFNITFPCVFLRVTVRVVTEHFCVRYMVFCAF